MGIKLKRVTCVNPATGIESDGVEFAESFAATLGAGSAVMGLAAGGLCLTVAGAPAGAALGATAAIGAGMAGIAGYSSWIAQRADKNRSPDNLYILVNGRKVWPQDKYRDVKAGETIELDIDCPIISSHLPSFLTGGKTYSGTLIALMEYDSGSKDDLLGMIGISSDSPKGIRTIALSNNKEDSEYFIEIEYT